MNYVIGDIHNDNIRFSKMLEKIVFSEEDHPFLLGDLFDRNSYEPDPVGVYFNVLKLGDRCTVIRGNHDAWLAEYEQIGVRADVSTNECYKSNYRKMHEKLPKGKLRYEDDINWEYYDSRLELCKDSFACDGELF